MRLIDADALRQKIENWKNDADKGNLFADSVESFAYDEVLSAIDVAPTIIRRPAASWVLGEDFMGEYFACSRCERKVRGRFCETAYCPHCGAVMIGE